MSLSGLSIAGGLVLLATLGPIACVIVAVVAAWLYSRS